MASLGEKVLAPLTSLAFRGAGEGLEAVAKAGRSIFLVGKKERLCRAAQDLSKAIGTPLLARQAEALTPGYTGAKAESPWLDGSELRKVTLVALPEAAGRLVTPVRPDAIAKQLHGKVAGQEVVLAVGEEDAFAAGLAVARCLPPYSEKHDRATEASLCNVSFHGCRPSDGLLQSVGLAGASVRVAQSLTDRPPCEVQPASFEEVVREAVKGVAGVTVSSIVGDELASRGYGLLHAVGKGAVVPPRLLVLTHGGKGDGCKGVALVGKGITFDTGGAALKPKEGMCGMKRDMGGAAGTFGAFLALAKAGGLPDGRPLHCVLCVAENAIGERMFLHDDIIKGYSGLTVEINNTDAEGRLVLADGVSHVAKHLNCELVVDMATLTGAQSISTGSLHALIVASHEDLEREAVAAGKHSGDMVHPGLFAPELLLKEFDSDFADMRNSVKDRFNAQSSCAGLFIWKHLDHCGYSGKWLHIDMAAPVLYLGDFATGWGVGFLTSLLRGEGSDERAAKRARSE